jgi:hypothetical protein
MVTSMVLAVGGASLATAPAALAISPPTSQGTDFWVTFESNCVSDDCSDGPGSLYLFISGSTATTGTVSDPGIAFSQTFSVTPGTVTTIQVPAAAEDDVSDSVEPDGIHITAGAAVSAYGLNTIPYTTDGFLGLPTPILGKSYIAEGYSGGNGSQFAVVGTEAGTIVTITPSENVDSYTAGTPYTVDLGAGQVYQLIDQSGGTGDLSGSTITSNNPVAVFAGNDCADVPLGAYACNTLTEEMTPVDTWGTSFLTEPLATRSGDTFRFMASENNTKVSVDGSLVATLSAGQFFETILSAASSITADHPIQVMQYSNGESYDGADADPFDITIPPSGQFLNSYTVSTEPAGADSAITQNYINIVGPTSEVGSITLDGSPVASSDFSPITGTTFSGAQVAVGFGSHVLGGPLPFGVTVYGYGGYDGYGYPGGFSLSPIAVVTSVTLSPATGTGAVETQACLVATVTDQSSDPIAGIQVGFTVTGANPQTGFAYTGTNGEAQFCYTGTTAGVDNIVAAVEAIHSTTSKWTWTGGTAAPPTASITTPANGATYTFGQAVKANYSCRAGLGGTLQSCVGPVADGADINTATVGSHTFKVTATDTDTQTGFATSTYTVKALPPKALITTPANGSVYTVGDSAAAAYTCTAGGGATLASCVGTVAVGSQIDTATAGTKTFKVTAKDSDGQTYVATSTYTVNPAPTQLSAPPLVLGLLPGQRLAVFEVEATLTYGASHKPLPGETVKFTAGGQTLCSAKTNSAGFVSCNYGLNGLLGAVLAPLSYQASFAGDANYLASKTTAPFIEILGLDIL